jgi:hypothetical protein
MDSRDSDRIVHQTAAEYTFFSTVHVTFSKLAHSRHKTSLKKYKNN